MLRSVARSRCLGCCCVSDILVQRWRFRDPKATGIGDAALAFFNGVALSLAFDCVGTSREESWIC